MTSGHQRRYFLTDIPLEEANSRFFGALEEAGVLSPMPGEWLPLAQAQGRVTAGPIWAAASSPHYDAAAMDGIAVRAAETAGATETAPVTLQVGTQAVWVDTGDPMPAGFDAVVMIEHLHRVGDGAVGVMSPVAPWQHVRPLGEDIVATELVLPENHLLGPVDLGACAAAGLTQLPVRRQPRVAIIPTGDELVPVGSPARPGEIIEYNSLMLAGMVRDWGGQAAVFPPVPDDFDAISGTVSRALTENDLVIVNAGSSAGSEDYTAAVVEGLGRLLVHGIAIRPGHPVVLGMAPANEPAPVKTGGGTSVTGAAVTPIIGLPGYPVSAVLTAELLVKPWLRRRLGLPAAEQRPRVSASITRKVSSPPGEDEFLRVKLGRVGGRMVATPVQRGAGVIMSLVQADGIARIPRFLEGLDAGAEVTVELLRPLEEVENTIVAIGSHDLTLDLLASHLRQRNPGLTLSSSHVGSLGGLVALRRGEAHLAGCHLLDEATGQYNVSYVERHLAGTPVVLVNLVGRVQGLMVAPGNPRGIHGLADLARTDVAFVNRQRGSGTRVLLDHKLAEMGLSAGQVRGYRREEFSHLAVAAAVRGGSADTGLGILSAARALGLEFVPLLQEQYDLVIPRVHYEGPAMQPFLELLQDPDFRREVEELGGYDSANMGRVWAEVG
jgi:putative molybdopterin biosynthesis protein